MESIRGIFEVVSWRGGREREGGIVRRSVSGWRMGSERRDGNVMGVGRDRDVKWKIRC